MTVNAAMFSVSTSDGRQEDPRSSRLHKPAFSNGIESAARYSTIHDTLPPNALHLYERDPRYILARGENTLCCNVPQKNSALTGMANAGARLVSPPPVSMFPGDYDVNYERRSLKVNASSRALCERTDPRGFQ